MRTIWKYELDLLKDGGINDIAMPLHAKALTVQNQRGALCLWVECDPQEPMAERRFIIVGTGFSFCSDGMSYVGTLQDRQFVWHVYEVTG